MSRRGWLLFAAMSVIWGIPYLLIKVALRDLDPAFLVFLRLGLGALVLLPIAARRGLQPVLAHWRPVAAFAVIEMAVPWLLLSDAEQHISSSLAGLLIAAVPLIGALLAWASGDAERMQGRRWFGLLVGLAGVIALLGLDVRGGSGQVRGAAEVLGVAVCYAIGPLIVQRRLGDVPAAGVNAVALSFAFLLYAPFALTSPPGRWPALDVVLSVAALGLVCTALAFLVFFALIAEIGPARAVVITYVNPAVAVALGVSVLGEPFTVGIAIGFPLVLLGSYFAAGTRRASAGAAPIGAAEGSGTADPAGVGGLRRRAPG